MSLFLAGPATVPDPPQYPDVEAGVPDSECVTGDWYLDTTDYAAQAFAFMTGLGIPVDALAFEGDMHLAVSPARMTWSIDSSLVAVGSVMGQSFSVPSPFSGNGEWGWAPAPGADPGSPAENFVVFDDWLWGVPPADAADGVELPPFVDPDVSSRVNCVGDVLALQGDGAPFVGNFVRSDSPDGATPVGSTP